jgi:hypothetical protein
MMKRIILSGLCAVALLTTCTTVKSGAGLSLNEAIEQSAEKTAGELPTGSRVAIAAFESASANLSDYIMEEITGALFDRSIEVADRRNLPYVYQELNLQMSGDVSDETAVSIGKFLGADMVITGQLIDLDGVYRYRTSAIRVEQATRASVTRLDVRSDETMRRMVAALNGQQTVVTKYGVSEDRTPQTAGAFVDRGLMFASRGEYAKANEDYSGAKLADWRDDSEGARKILTGGGSRKIPDNFPPSIKETIGKVPDDVLVGIGVSGVPSQAVLNAKRNVIYQISRMLQGMILDYVLDSGVNLEAPAISFQENVTMTIFKSPLASLRIAAQETSADGSVWIVALMNKADVVSEIIRATVEAKKVVPAMAAVDFEDRINSAFDFAMREGFTAVRE